MVHGHRTSLRLSALAIGIASFAWATQLQAAILEGRTVYAIREHRTTMFDLTTSVDDFAVVGPGVEFPEFGARTNPPLTAFVDIDVADTTILITLITDQSQAVLERLIIQKGELGMTPPLLKNAFVDPSTNWAGFVPNRLNVVTNALAINVSELMGRAGQFILLNVTPEPAAASLLWPALGLVAARRRRRRASSRKVSPAPVGDPS